MDRSTSQGIKLTLAAFAAVVMVCAALPGPSATAESYYRHPQTIHNRRVSAANPNLILFNRGAFDASARADLDTARADSAPQSNKVNVLDGPGRKQLRVIQFAGPIKRLWLERLAATGSEIVGYIPNNAYIIRGTANQIAQAAGLHAEGIADDLRPICWMGHFQPLLKIDSAYDENLLTSTEAGTLDVEIELLDAPEASLAVDYVDRVALNVNRAPRRFLQFIVLSVTVPASELLNIATLDEVLFINPAYEISLNDERSSQIVAGNLSADATQPLGPGYLEWLASKGLNTSPNFLIDFTDTGLDRGSTADTLIHPDFLDLGGRSRVAYNINYGRDLSEDRQGHGTLVASIAGGLGSPERKDSDGYMYGMGVDPYSGLGASRIFSEYGRLPFQLSFTTVASTAFASGACISNNSWGGRGNNYDAAAQEYDALTRDARPGVTGNQEMLFVFSAGNTGAGSISSPGTAKNVIAVAASENYRPEGFDSCNLDGGGAIGPEGANSALDILRFSSGGPTFDGRAKPDISAPGTHVFGAASQAPMFNANALCPGTPIYQPPGQRFYTWSSGTSLAAPQISGAASLVRRFFTQNHLLGDARPPSPAMIKAFLVNSALYLTGDNAGGDLPAERQGWGGVNLARAFDNGRRLLVDQTSTFTETGQVFEIRGAVLDRTRPLRVTLAWTDAPGSLAGAPQVNDLDLEISVGDVAIYRGNYFDGGDSIAGGEPDRLNNIESIFISPNLIPAGTAGNLTITVRAANIAGDGVPGDENALDQDFALVVYNIGDPLIDPPPPPPVKIPVITGAGYNKRVLTITGRDFTGSARVEVNGQVLAEPFSFNAASNSLSVKKKARKLKLNQGADNRIVLIENGERSAAFTLRL